MTVNKRGDHLIATGLAKTLGDISQRLAATVGDVSEGRVLLQALSRCSRHISGGLFDAVIDKGKPVQASDEHSQRFGECTLALTQQVEMLLFSVQFRRGIEGGDQAARARDLDLANRQLATSKGYTVLAVGRFFDTAIDERVAAQLAGRGLGGEIEATRAALDRLRQAICRAIEVM